uniref:ATP synthase subunit a n=4 Tax=Reticulitermes TaxID=36988 RepID=A0A8T9KMI3_9NEOP|nr:ATP synthase F0 subunit 6 [Reticulitermes aculabialis]YP_009642863.1 ATP synthase F0 subunit 6 [Reticulitermes leptomandibularis]YP_010352223.1 ATP synthase F0 subunit 6 [Reticulitermes citrinus]YP_010352236.1 ATP synthase F0 subunit 6 [Reticulitermes dabieshanensis]AJO61983.1 ATP synthase F0 subunit 6 [Reticulitermes aculabialis]QCP70901.1 ATP synthase F0 subunit 6 [Reticulitermes leptomandibularis]UOL50317.1 ATP synthase F0 subunit 6 [Reticulitermes citrinus]UOL50330.1 ATP synthase F0 s
MSNLFSIFDPTTEINSLPMNWTSTMVGLLLIPTSIWLTPSRNSMALNLLMNKLHTEMKTILSKGDQNKGNSFIFTSLFLMILMNNFLGLFPYIFTSTSHLTLTLTLALPLWMTFMLFGWIKNTNHMFEHLVPQGTPTMLMPFMVIIETISNLIRPGTLAVRLTANMIAGHLLLTLLGNNGPTMNHTLLAVLITAQILLLILESAVAIIQSYVFAILSTLYSSEVN